MKTRETLLPLGDRPRQIVRVGEGACTLPLLVGSEKQLKWAAAIRILAFGGNWTLDPERWNTFYLMMHIDDSTWWIANRGSVERGEGKLPALTQLVGCRWPPGFKLGNGQTSV